MTDFIEGESRSQTTLFPESLDDYIADDSAVRVIDVFIDELDLGELGFKADPEARGRPAYHPATMLKLYVYGYLNKIQSTRRLEQEANRNVELMWLTKRLAPDFKTIADFSKNNGKAIRQVCAEFVLLCKQLELFSDSMVAIDGSKFKAVNSRDKNYTPAKLKRRLAEVERSISGYLVKLERADLGQSGSGDSRVEHLQEKIKSMKKEMRRLKKCQAELEKTPEGQVSVTDPDSRSMKTRGSGIVGYNVQAAVECRNHFIIGHEVINEGSDRHQLAPMAKQVKEIMEVESLQVLADRGYFEGNGILECEEAGIEPLVPKPETSPSKAENRFSKEDFVYVEDLDVYRCPAGEHLEYRFTSMEKGKDQRIYWATVCGSCSIKAKCTTGKERRVRRWEHEEVLERMQDRLDESPKAMRIRRQTVEHPFGTLKAWMGHTHFQMKTLKHVRTEMSLHILAYNMRRVMNIMGVKPLLEAMRA
ncbi:MAG: IS1182 family transposase [Gammaproteobacteria bacterium]|nr:IS1182 family transposase [Pseudomonadales bacterium]